MFKIIKIGSIEIGTFLILYYLLTYISVYLLPIGTINEHKLT